MTVKRIIAIVVIFGLGTFGWVVLGEANWIRSNQASASLTASVQSLWGSPIVQTSPELTIKVPGTDRTRTLTPSRNQISVDIDLEQRRKGLLWYPTYTVDFHGRYEVFNDANIAQDIRLFFALPSKDATYQNVVLKIGGRTERLDTLVGYSFYRIIPLEPGERESIEVIYRTRGIHSWTYQLNPRQGLVNGLDLVVKTNFTDVDFIDGSLSPMKTESRDDGLDIHWQANELITRQDVGISLPQKLNPGPLAARMSFFAPVCLLFFFVLITSICVTRQIDIHPMHYLFVNAGFFAFHLLFAYTIDLINVHLAFALSAIVSVALVVSYLARALGETFPWKIAALGQGVYLVLFSYSFFLKGMTGLTVTIASIATLAILMRITANTDWSQVFVRRPKEAHP